MGDVWVVPGASGGCLSRRSRVTVNRRERPDSRQHRRLCLDWGAVGAALCTRRRPNPGWTQCSCGRPDRTDCASAGRGYAFCVDQRVI